MVRGRSSTMPATAGERPRSEVASSSLTWHSRIESANTCLALCLSECKRLDALPGASPPPFRGSTTADEDGRRESCQPLPPASGSGSAPPSAGQPAESDHRAWPRGGAAGRCCRAARTRGAAAGRGLSSRLPGRRGLHDRERRVVGPLLRGPRSSVTRAARSRIPPCVAVLPPRPSVPALLRGRCRVVVASLRRSGHRQHVRKASRAGHGRLCADGSAAAPTTGGSATDAAQAQTRAPRVR